jgi:hypothetical protein
MVHTAPDGKEFETRKEWREYIMRNFYGFKDKVDEPEPLFKMPGDIKGSVFDIGDCVNCTLGIMDHSEQVQIDECKGCKIFIPACASSIFIRNCENCVFYTACRQLRLREAVNCTFYILSMSEVHIEYSKGLKFAPFNGGYPEHAEHLKAANLNISHNLWYDIYDHNDAAKTRENWCLLPEAEYAEPWYPAGPCEAAIPRTQKNSVEVAETTDMQSFSLQDMKEEFERQKIATAASKSSPSVPPPIPSLPSSEQVIAPTRGPETAPASPAVSPPVTTVPTTEGAIITQLIKTFCSYKVGMDLSLLVDTSSFSQVGPSGKSLSAADLEACAPLSPGRLWSIGAQGVKVSSSSDIAHVTYYAWVSDSNDGADAPPSVCAFTACLSNSVEGWRITLVQGSGPISIQDLPPPTTFF